MTSQVKRFPPTSTPRYIFLNRKQAWYIMGILDSVSTGSASRPRKISNIIMRQLNQ